MEADIEAVMSFRVGGRKMEEMKGIQPCRIRH